MGKRKGRQSSTACGDDPGAPAINRHDDDDEDKTSPREPLNAAAAAAVSAAVPAAASAAAGLPASEAEENGRTRPEASSDSRKKRRKDKKKEKKRRTDDRLTCASTGTHTSPDAPGTRNAGEGEEPEPSDATKASGTFVTTVQVHCGCVEG
jgi:hypothetical protein